MDSLTSTGGIMEQYDRWGLGMHVTRAAHMARLLATLALVGGPRVSDFMSTHQSRLFGPCATFCPNQWFCRKNYRIGGCEHQVTPEVVVLGNILV